MAKRKTPSPRITDRIGGFVAKYRSTFALPVLACIGMVCARFMAPMAAMLVTAILGLSWYLLAERKRRMFWERTVSFRLMELVQANRALSKKLDRPAEATPAPPKKDKPIYERSKRYDHIVVQEGDIEITKEDVKTRRILSPASRLGHSKNKRGVVKPPRTVQKKAAPKKATQKEVFYSDSLIRDFIRGGLEKGSLQVERTPIMRMPHFDAQLYMLSAGVKTYDGSTLKPARYMRVAKQHGLQNKISCALIDGAMRLAADQAGTLYCIAVTSTVFTDGAFMAHFIDQLREKRDQAKQIVLSLEYHDFQTMPVRARQIMRSLGQLGCQFMLRGVDSLVPDIETMQSLHIKSLMMPARFLVKQVQGPESFRSAIKSRRMIEGHGIRVIVDGVETAAMMEQLKDLAPRYMVGPGVVKPAAGRVRAA